MKRTMMRMRPAALLIVVGALLAPLPAAASGTKDFAVRPDPLGSGATARRSFVTSIVPGETTTDAIAVSNRTSQPLSLAVYAADATVGDDGAITVALRGTARRGVSRWITLERSTVTLPARATSVVGFTFAPADVRAAVRHAAIVVEPATAQSDGVAVVQRVALMFRTDAIVIPAAPVDEAPDPAQAQALAPVPGRSPITGMPDLGAMLPWLAAGGLFGILLLWKRRRREDDEEEAQAAGESGEAAPRASTLVAVTAAGSSRRPVPVRAASPVRGGGGASVRPLPVGERKEPAVLRRRSEPVVLVRRAG